MRESIAQKYKLNDADFVGSYCLHPGFLKDQVETSRRNLGLDTLDLVYLHNPETWKSGMPQSAFIDKLTRAMEVLEELRGQGKLNYYGISTYAGLRVDHHHPSYLMLDDILKAAEKAGGKDHGLKYLSLPMNLVMTEPLLEKHQPSRANEHKDSKEIIFKSTLEKINELQLNAMITQPFLSGFLLQTPLPTSVFRSRYIPVKQINLLRSLPFDCIKSVVVGQKTNRHTKINIQIAQTPLVDKDVLQDYLTTPKKRIFDNQIEDPLQS